MHNELIRRADAYFQHYLGVTLDALCAPIDSTTPGGKSLRGGSVYSAVEAARRQDDPTLPMGAWERDLKRADWDKVSALAVDALVNKSKDLQLAGWLLEARIHATGFAGVAPCMLLMQALCERYWDELHPQAEGGDLEYRANIFHWINEKLLPALRTVPVTAGGRERDYSWADWEQARRNEQLRASASGRDQPQIEGVTAAEVLSAIGATPTDAFLALHGMLSDALESIASLSETLDTLFGREAPSLMALADLLEQILSLVESELHKRGIRPDADSEPQSGLESGRDAEDAQQQMQAETEHDAQPSRPVGGIRDRADAYARLIEAADFLMRLEPHSPAPYLVKRATEWGRLNTVELYQELFLNLGGQLNIFEMLGLSPQQTGEPG